MEVTDVVTMLDDYGEAKAEKVESGKVVFHLSGNFDSLSEIESFVEVIDRLPTAEIVLTGDRRNALSIIRMDVEEFTEIPPYLEENWRDADDEHNF